MSRHNHNIPKSGSVYHLSAEENTIRMMPKYDAYVCRGGVHGDTSYNRRKDKRALRRQLAEEL